MRSYAIPLLILITACLPALAEDPHPQVLSGFKGRPIKLCFSPDGTLLATSFDVELVIVWDIKTRKQLLNFSNSERKPQAISISADGKAVLTVSLENEVLQIDPVTGKFLAGRQVNAIKAWDVRSGEMKVVVNLPHEEPLGFSPDAKMFASRKPLARPNPFDPKDIPPPTDTTVHMWDVATGKEVAALKGHKTYVDRIVFSPDGKLVGTVSADGTKIWDCNNWKERTSWTGIKGLVAFSPDNRLLAVASAVEPVRNPDASALKLFDVDTGKEVRSMKRQQWVALYWHTCVAFSPDGKTLATGLGFSPHVQLWDVATGNLKSGLKNVEGKKSEIRVVAFSPDGKKLVAAGADGSLLIWEVPLEK